jgi:hypothetical protein
MLAFLKVALTTKVITQSLAEQSWKFRCLSEFEDTLNVKIDN